MELVKVNKIQKSKKHNSSISSARGFYSNNENAIEIESSINSDSSQTVDKFFIVAKTHDISLGELMVRLTKTLKKTKPIEFIDTT